MKYDVFISFKNSGKNGQATPDAAAARRVHAALKERGMSVFFSEESLAEKGQGHFGKSIESALDSARVLILVASCREHIESRWVETEWDSFLQDVRSGNKEGELFIFNCGDLKPTDLPLFLRRQQMFPESGLEKLITFVSNAMSPVPTLNDLIELSLHCYRPEKNEDKVYVVTVQQGASAATRNVAAHWGARSAKRLSSQVKAINVSADAAREEVEKAKQEKLRGGYGPASHVNLLTSEAWSFLSASLGLIEAPPREKPSAQVPKKGSARATPASTKPTAGKAVGATSKKVSIKVGAKPMAVEPVRVSPKRAPTSQPKVTAGSGVGTTAKVAAKGGSAAPGRAPALPTAVEGTKVAKAMSATATKSPIKPTVVEPKTASVKVKPGKATQAVATVPKIAAPTKPKPKPKPKPISRDKAGVGAKAGGANTTKLPKGAKQGAIVNAAVPASSTLILFSI